MVHLYTLMLVPFVAWVTIRVLIGSLLLATVRLLLRLTPPDSSWRQYLPVLTPFEFRPTLLTSEFRACGLIGCKDKVATFTLEEMMTKSESIIISDESSKASETQSDTVTTVGQLSNMVRMRITYQLAARSSSAPPPSRFIIKSMPSSFGMRLFMSLFNMFETEVTMLQLSAHALRSANSAEAGSVPPVRPPILYAHSCNSFGLGWMIMEDCTNPISSESSNAAPLTHTPSDVRSSSFGLNDTPRFRYRSFGPDVDQQLALEATPGALEAVIDAAANYHRAMQLMCKSPDLNAAALLKTSPLYLRPESHRSWCEVVQGRLVSILAYHISLRGLRNFLHEGPPSVARHPAVRTIVDWFVGPSQGLMMLQSLRNDAAVHRPEFFTICHGDFHAGNIIFATSHDDHAMRSTTSGSDTSPSIGCVVVDWQMSSYSLVTRDLSLFLLGSLTRESRQKHEGRLVRRYFEKLTGRCPPPPIRPGAPPDSIAPIDVGCEFASVVSSSNSTNSKSIISCSSIDRDNDIPVDGLWLDFLTLYHASLLTDLAVNLGGGWLVAQSNFAKGNAERLQRGEPQWTDFGQNPVTNWYQRALSKMQDAITDHQLDHLVKTIDQARRIHETNKKDEHKHQ